MKVVLVDSHIIAGYNFGIERGVIEAAGHTFVTEECKNEDEAIERCLDADVIMDIVVRLTEKSISRLKNCVGLVRYGVGVDEFDVAAATAKGIKVCNVSKYCIEEVAVHALSLLLACARQHKHYDRCVRDGLWNSSQKAKMRRLSAQTVGLVGFGNIPKKITGYLRALGFRVVAYDPFVQDAAFAGLGAEKVGLDELYQMSDLISLHCPLTPETDGMINESSIAKMKDGVILVNTSRGPLINDEDFVKALKGGKVAGAGLDVMRTEPMKDPGNPYCGLDNVILTPHISWSSSEASLDLFRQVAETAVALLAGETPYNVLNAKDLGLLRT